MATFLKDYTDAVAEALVSDFPDNYDEDRFGSREKRGVGVSSLIRRAMHRCGFVTAGEANLTVSISIQFAEPHLGNLEWLYSRLADEESREILVKLVAFRALGSYKVKLPLNSPEHWARIEGARKLAVTGETLDPGFLGFPLHEMDLAQYGYPIRIFFTPAGVVADFIEQQYLCQTCEGTIEVEHGDRVVDAGGCWGDTALYFAYKAGETGMVASFEFLPSNLEIFKRNLALNPELARRIQIHQNAVWSASGETLAVNVNGPGTTVDKAPAGLDAPRVKTISLDDMVRDTGLDRVDFIKMDIEGAELEALRGAKGVLKRFKPKLAIAVYHDFKDFWTIPQYLEQLNLGYRFYLRHFTIHAEETVLFAGPQAWSQ